MIRGGKPGRHDETNNERAFPAHVGNMERKRDEPAGAPDKYAKINSLLVDFFELHLRGLESGSQFTGEEKRFAVKEAIQKSTGF